MKTMYYIAVLPPEDLRKEIKSFKEEVWRDHDSKHALRSPAHITLQMPFHFEEDLEEQLLKGLQALSEKFEPFDCKLKNFGHFDDRVIFIEVCNNPDLKQLRDTLQQYLGTELHFTDKQLPKRFHPHITIANRDLTRQRFPNCWEAFSQREYQRSFTAQSLYLLKHRGTHWEAYREIPFTQP